MLTAATSFGWARTEIATASLRARVALLEDRVDEALQLSTRAVTELHARGGAVPAVRSEEILFTHTQGLHAAQLPEAESYSAEAVRVVHEKGESLTDEGQRRSFLSRVRLSRDVIAAG